MPTIGKKVYDDALWAVAESLIPAAMGLGPGQVVYMSEESHIKATKRIYKTLERGIVDTCGSLGNISHEPPNVPHTKITIDREQGALRFTPVIPAP